MNKNNYHICRLPNRLSTRNTKRASKRILDVENWICIRAMLILKIRSGNSLMLIKILRPSQLVTLWVFHPENFAKDTFYLKFKIIPIITYHFWYNCQIKIVICMYWWMRLHIQSVAKLCISNVSCILLIPVYLFFFEWLWLYDVLGANFLLCFQVYMITPRDAIDNIYIYK